MASRGRPPKSQVRQNLVEILFIKGKAFGYELAKVHNSIFPKCTPRLIYYHLRKGTAMGIFKIQKIAKEQGDFSWGSSVERIYYELDENASPRLNPRAKKWFEQQGKIK